ncbi:alpha/beta hydrolase-fold protein [Sphingosinicella sp. LHD-64]|uniref:alpha/beta hydrolase n=1 Tax=Sphingosinicella sp. LHD-64 TaxID=3072139 RepID=UPI00280C7D1B|nr:alpha/beta hydrolase-fold protein [Sphingosinicella sp. LHD-64]MDQ8757293.1 alpha/beta hydrolase-fold protein [Sphingosinicella sp. LHD-64]
MRPFAAFAAALLSLAAPAWALADPVAIPVTIAPAAAPAPLSGRLIVFAQRVEPGAAPQTEIDSSPFAPTNTAVAAREVHALASGQTALVDGEVDAFPSRFSELPAGTYRFQAVLDRNHDYNYGGRGAGDIVSPVVEARLPGAVPQLTLGETLPERAPDAFLANVPEAEREATRTAWGQTVEVDFASPKLSAFWGRPVHMRGWIALPPGYRADGPTFPVAYSTHGFGGSLRSQRVNAAQAIRRMAAGEWPPMIWVFLDQSSATGTHEFADSVNNGPWGEALTTELIPWLESRYRMDARPNGRFLTGHSSGGWATLWLQVRYPELFGGTWPTAPDASDFHDFTNIDIYAPNANAYRGADGTALPLVRNEGRVAATLEQFARLESVLGAYGGQFASFDWVFSPKGPDGRPLQLFDRATGVIDPAVAAYWRDNYDIAHMLARDWARLRPHLDGKIHVIVGTADTFYLDGSARRLQAVLDRLGARASFTYVDGGTHFSLYRPRPDGTDLMRDIAQAMYAVARPGGRRVQ